MESFLEIAETVARDWLFHQHFSPVYDVYSPRFRAVNFHTLERINAALGLTARYRGLNISLEDDADNAEILYLNNGYKTQSVTLAGRTLSKDGAWNTLCLPFRLSSLTGTPLENAVVMTLSSSEFTDGTLTLNFSEATATEAGTPFFVKITEGEDIVDPVFPNVTINDAVQPVVTDVVTFQGSFGQFVKDDEDKTLLYLDSPPGNLSILQVSSDMSSTSVTKPSLVRSLMKTYQRASAKTTNSLHDNKWYTIDGRKLIGKPVEKGIYIWNKRKVVVK